MRVLAWPKASPQCGHLWSLVVAALLVHGLDVLVEGAGLAGGVAAVLALVDTVHKRVIFQ